MIQLLKNSDILTGASLLADKLNGQMKGLLAVW